MNRLPFGACIMTFNIKPLALELGKPVAESSCASEPTSGREEVDRGTNRSHGVDQPARLAELTNMQASFAPALHEYDAGQYGLVVLVAKRLNVVSSKGHDLDQVEAGETRAALEVDIALSPTGTSPGLPSSHALPPRPPNEPPKRQRNRIGRAASARHPSLAGI